MEAEEARQRLEKEKARLVTMQEDIDEQGHTSESLTESLGELSSLSIHQADLGTEMFNRERDLSILEEIEAELADVAHAIRRIDDGTYGICEACGAPIPDSRLEAVPAARFCLKDQAAAEGSAESPPIAR
jgi:DnaK suppressor protein